MDVFIKVDKQGRMVVPSRIRRKYKTNRFILEEREKWIVLKPIMSIDRLFGCLPDLDLEKLKEEHIMEVENEDRD